MRTTRIFRRTASLATLVVVLLLFCTVDNAAEDNVTLKPGDLVKVRLHGLLSGNDAVVDEFDEHVDSDGNVPLPVVGYVKVIAMGLTEAGRAIDKKYADAQIVKDCKATVQLSSTGEKSTSISPGDRVRVRMWQLGVPLKEESVEAEVAADGTVDAPELGRVKIGGMTESKAMSALPALYEKAGRPNVVVAMTRIGTTTTAPAVKP